MNDRIRSTRSSLEISIITCLLYIGGWLVTIFLFESKWFIWANHQLLVCVILIQGLLDCVQTLISSQISFFIRWAISSFASSAKLGQDFLWTKCFFILEGNEPFQLGFTKSLWTNCQVVIWMRTWATVLIVVKQVLIKILVSHEIEWVLVHQEGRFDTIVIFEC